MDNNVIVPVPYRRATRQWSNGTIEKNNAEENIEPS